MPSALPPAGDTSQSRPPVAPQTDALSLREASERYGVSVSTLRRRLGQGDIAGAYRVPGPQGDEWRLPPGSLDALGYREQKSATVALSETAPIADDLRRLTDALAAVTEALASERRLIAAAEQDRLDARVEHARIEAQLEAAREKAADLEARLAAATARRGFFGRRRKAAEPLTIEQKRKPN